MKLSLFNLKEEIINNAQERLKQKRRKMYAYLKEESTIFNLKSRGMTSESRGVPEILVSNNVENKQEKMYQG